MLKKVYLNLRKCLPANYRSQLSKIPVILNNKPSVNPGRQIDSQICNNKGGLVISADFEMAWAFRYSKRNIDPIQMGLLEREQVPVLVKTLAEFNIPITWATVGHLMLDKCSKGDHDWMKRIPYFNDHWKFTSGDWFDHDPYTSVTQNSAWYAPDLIELILNSKVRHEIGCHTFSHIDCSDQNCPPEVLDDELVACKQVAQKWDIKYKSFVFPGGTFGNYPILQKHGFGIYRKSTEYQLALPFYDSNGLLVTTSSYSFGKSYNWDPQTYIKKYRQILDWANKTNTIAHIWLHPSVDRWTLDNVIPEVLKYAAEQREKGLLWIGTMGQIADHIHGRSL